MIANNNSVEQESFGAPAKQVVGGMSMKNLSKIINIVTTQLYSNPIGSIVRELTSNCFDAHIKLQQLRRLHEGYEDYVYDQPVIVQYSEEEGQGFVTFIDVGTGLSPEQMEDIYINIGESDKENDNDAIGYYGLGSKSFLSYTPSADVVTIVDGIKYSYIVYKNPDGLLTYDLLYEQETDEHSGTSVKLNIGNKRYQKLGYIVPDKGYVDYDWRAEDFLKFRKEIINQLHYFDNVYTQGFDLENDYRLYEAETFKIRTGVNPFTELHIILGKVAYPINWEFLGRESIKIPIGIKFSIGELMVPPNRESVQYEENKIDFINQKIDSCIEEIRTRYNKNSTEVDTLEEYLRHLESPNKILIIQDVEIKIPKKQELNKKGTNYISVDAIDRLNEVKWKPLAHLPIEIPKDPFWFFTVKGQLSRPDGKGNCKLNETASNNVFSTVNKYKDNIYRIKDERSKQIDSFLSFKHKDNQLPILITKGKTDYKPEKRDRDLTYGKIFENQLGLGDMVSRRVTEQDLLGKKKIHTPILIPITVEGQTTYWNKTRIIQEYKKIITRDLIARTQSYDKQIPSAQYLAELQLQKLAKRRVKLEGIITIYDLVNNNSSQGTQLNLSKLEFFKGFIIYGEREKQEKLQNVKLMLTNFKPQYSKRIDKIIPFGRTKILSLHSRRPIWVDNYVVKTFGGNLVSRTEESLYGREAKLRSEVGRVFITAKSNHKLLQNNPYFMHVDEFLSNGNRMFRTTVTAWYVSKELNLITSSNANLINNMLGINNKLYDAWNTLEDWADKNYKVYFRNDEFMETCYAVAKEKDMLWVDKIDELEKIKRWFSKDLKIFDYLEPDAFADKEVFQEIVTLLKSKKKRLSAEHYVIPSPVEEQIIEEAKEQVEYRLSLEPMKKQLIIYNNNRQVA